MTVLASPSSHPIHLRKERDMQHAEQRLQQVQAQQAEFRRQREAERSALTAAQAGRTERRTVRHQVGRRLIRLGERVAGDAITAPAWQG
jgi:hypothetical protein